MPPAGQPGLLGIFFGKRDGNLCASTLGLVTCNLSQSPVILFIQDGDAALQSSEKRRIVIHEIVKSPLKLNRSQGLSGKVFSEERSEFLHIHITVSRDVGNRPESKGLA
jgi:hypothetical protein